MYWIIPSLSDSLEGCEQQTIHSDLSGETGDFYYHDFAFWLLKPQVLLV